jgi:sigma-E factor negative regulatory protein RseA
MTYANHVSSQLDWHQQMSALMDGTLDVQQTQALLQACEQDNDLVQAWASYHAAGDALRTHWTGRTASGSTMAAQGVSPAIVAKDTSKRAANDSVFRWRLVAGFAAITAIGSIIWSLAGNQSGPTGAQLAQQVPQNSSQPAVAAAGPATVVASSIEQAAPPQIMLRDPRLDELLAAHKQFGGASALQQPAGFLRNATFVPSSR